MALTNFVPTIWSRELNFALRRNLVGLNTVNQDYIGEIKNAGDTLKINRPAAVSTGTYTPGSDITIGTPTSTTLSLLIDQFKYFAFDVDDVRKVQSSVELMRPYLDEATYAVRKLIDEFIFGLYAGVDSGNVITKSTLSKTTIYNKITEAAENLDVNDVPEDGRYMVLSPVEITFLRDSSEFISASDLGDEVKRTGFVGQVAGFNIFKSNSLTTASDGTDNVKHCPYGHSMGITFGVQFTEVERARMELRFADLVKGLTLYGAKVVKPKAFGDLRAIIA